MCSPCCLQSLPEVLLFLLVSATLLRLQRCSFPDARISGCGNIEWLIIEMSAAVAMVRLTWANPEPATTKDCLVYQLLAGGKGDARWCYLHVAAAGREVLDQQLYSTTASK